MAEQSAKHFTRFTAKYCQHFSKNSKKTPRRTTFAIRSKFADLNRPLSPKIADKDALSI